MKTYLVQLTFDAESEPRIRKTLELNRQAWNRCSETYFKNPTGGLKAVHDACYYKIREEFPEIPSQIVIKAEQDVISAYRSIKSNKQKISAPAVKKKLSMQLDKRIYKLVGDKISITAAGGTRISGKLLLYPRVIEAIKNGFQDPKLFYRNEKFWLAVPCKTPEPTLPEPKLCVGVDLGLNRAVVTSEGLFIRRKKLNKRLRQLAHQRRQLQKKKTKSARKRLKKLSNKHRNFSKDFTHCCVNAVLATQADTIAIEWLKSLKGKNRGRHMNRRLHQWAHGEFKTILEYKALALGKRVVTVKPAFTSQNDWRGIPKGKRQGSRYYASDGAVFDADWNAAYNIAKLSNIPVSHRKVLDGQAPVNEPNVFKSFVCCHGNQESYMLGNSFPRS